MNAPLAFVLLPALAAAGAYLLQPIRRRLTIYLCAGLSLAVAWLSSVLPLDTTISVLGISVPISSTFLVFGRPLTFDPGLRPAIVFLYLGGAVLIAGSLIIPPNRRFLPVTLVVQSLFTASLFVLPFLYAAIFLVLSVACLSLTLTDSTHSSLRGATRWIVFSSLGMPFLLLAGSELAYLSGLPLDPDRARPLIAMLAIGFGLLLAFPPFHFWLPDAADESPPYSMALILSLYFGGAVFFLLRFLDTYTWLRTSAETYSILQTAGCLFCAVGGLFALIQVRFGRAVGYLSLVNLGAILLGLSTARPEGVQAAMVLLAARGVSLIVWGVTLQGLRRKSGGDGLDDLRGLASTQPLACAGAILAGLSLVGLPGLLSFPGFWAVLRLLDPASSGSIWPLLILILSMSAGIVVCLRFAQRMLEAPIGWPLPEEGGRAYRLLIGFSIVCFFFFGLVPQFYLPWVAGFAKAFTNLAGIP